MQSHTDHKGASYLGATHEKPLIGNAIAVALLGIYGVIFMVVAHSDAYSTSMAMSRLHVGLVSVSTSSQTMKALAISIHVPPLARMYVGIRTTMISMHAT